MEPARSEPVPDTTSASTTPDAGRDEDEPATHRPERNSLVPPYWQRQENSKRLSSYSLENGSRPAPILLEDHTDEASEQHKALWAKHVSIDDYVIVGNSPAPAFGAYVVWTITVETLDVSYGSFVQLQPQPTPSPNPVLALAKGGPMKIRKRFSEFDDLREKLVQSFPHAASSMPPLPPKSVVSRFRPKFLERRRVGLAYFLNCILLNPEFAGSPVLKEFLFS